VIASVLIGSVNGGEMIHHLLAALRRQSGEVPFEVIVADRCSDGTAERIARDDPNVRVLRADTRTTLPELRTRALECARGRVILVTEDHTVPPCNWVERFVHELNLAPPRVAGVAGPVDNAMRERAVDWAAFFCEYSAYVPPVEAGEVDDVPGMNIAYRREVLDAADREALSRGFWESTLHPRLVAEGRTFLRAPDVVIQHRKRFGLFYFAAQRFHYSRYFAGERFPRAARARRWLYSALSLGLPALILTRIALRLWRRAPYRVFLLRSLPAMVFFSFVWGIGETVGYLFGPGDSLARIE
jgi:glycosyltransferase involved in cell wall biosynthesis